MKFDVELYDKLRNMKKPEDLIDTPILKDIPSPLKIHTILSDELMSLISPSKLVFQGKKPYKPMKNNQEDNLFQGMGYLDEAGNFVLSKSKKIPITWLVKRDSKVDGPFTEKEMKSMAGQGLLNGSIIKRDFDKGYVEANKLIEEIPEFYVGTNLNKYFVENQIIESKSQNDDFYSNIVTKDKNNKLSNFMKNANINCSVDFLIKTMNRMRKADAINAIAGITGLDRAQNEVLVELIIEDSKTQILSDVDKDGFEISNNKTKKKFFRKK